MAKRAYSRVTIKRHYKDFTGAPLVNFCNGVSTAISGSPLITTPIITLILFGTHISTLVGILGQRVTDKSPDLERDQNQAETVLWDDLDAYADQIVQITNAATPGDTATIEGEILSFGFQIRGKGGKNEQTFEVIDTDHAEATITFPIPDDSPRGNIYICSTTITPLDAASWSTPMFCTESKLTVTGLPPDKRSHFRRAVITPQGLNPVIDSNVDQIVWESDTISALIP